MASVPPAPPDLPASLRNIIDYRKSGLSLNHIVGCPLDCGYCVRHIFFNFDMKRPHLVMNDEDAVDLLTRHWAFRPGITPIQLFNRATDPFLPGVKEHLFSTLEELDGRALTNPVLVITRWRIKAEDVKRLENLQHVKLTILITWSGIQDDRIEPIDSTISERSLVTLYETKQRTKTILYWRPLIAGVNDSDCHLTRAREISRNADATVFTGLFHRKEIRDYLRELDVPDLYEKIARRKVLPQEVEQRVLSVFDKQPLFRKTSCGVAFVHGISDYNGHYCIRELCDICPSMQVSLCAAAHNQPNTYRVRELALVAGLNPENINIEDRCIRVNGSSEEQRYFMQHMLNYQVHDRVHPHFPNRHGRAEIGWP